MYSLFSGSSLARTRIDRAHSIAVCLPALNEEATIGYICESIDTQLRKDSSLVDELIVVDCGSEDATSERARAAGATVVQTGALEPAMSFGGKGEALWKSLTATRSTIAVWLDSDVTNFEADWVVELVRPLLVGKALMTKGSYRRPLGTDLGQESGGGRVTELLARPLINAFWPEISHLRQPLAGECASFTSLLRTLPFLTGYAVELGVVATFAQRFGGDSIHDVDLGVRRHRNRSLVELGRMSFEILHGATMLLAQEGRGDLSPGNTFLQPLAEGSSTHHVDVRMLPSINSISTEPDEEPLTTVGG